MRSPSGCLLLVSALAAALRSAALRHACLRGSQAPRRSLVVSECPSFAARGSGRATHATHQNARSFLAGFSGVGVSLPTPAGDAAGAPVCRGAGCTQGAPVGSADDSSCPAGRPRQARRPATSTTSGCLATCEGAPVCTCGVPCAPWAHAGGRQPPVGLSPHPRVRVTRGARSTGVPAGGAPGTGPGQATSTTEVAVPGSEGEARHRQRVEPGEASAASQPAHPSRERLPATTREA